MDSWNNALPIMPENLQPLTDDIRRWARELGFTRLGITDVDLAASETRLKEWLERGFAGEMEWMHRHGTRRSHPPELVPGTVRVISVAMDYLPESQQAMWRALDRMDTGYISRYALGQGLSQGDAKRLATLARPDPRGRGRIRLPAPSVTVPRSWEKPLAEKAGLGWIGKHTNLLSRDAGSWFFLGELYVNLPLPVDEPVSAHCGSCTACIDICPTRAIVAPWVLDARRCISYLTIELPGAIPEEFRTAIGNRVFGCDDCQLVCPWNRYARVTAETDFLARHPLHDRGLGELFSWDETTFLEPDRGIRHSTHRIHSLAAEHCRSAWQCAAQRFRDLHAAAPGSPSLVTGSRTRPLALERIRSAQTRPSRPASSRATRDAVAVLLFQTSTVNPASNCSRRACACAR